MDQDVTQEFWRKVFDGFEEPSPLAFGYNDKYRGSVSDWEISLPPEIPPDILIATWALLQSRYSGEECVTVGFRGLEDPVVHPLRLEVNEELTVAAYIESISVQLDEQLRVYPIDIGSLCTLLQWKSEVPLFLSSFVQGLDGRTALCGAGEFLDETIDRVSGHFEHLLDVLRQGGSSRLRVVEYLSENERDMLIRDWNPDSTPYPETTLQNLFGRQVDERGTAVALVYGNRSVSYDELNTMANRLAHYLINRGIHSGQSVAIFLNRGIEQIVATLAILKAGAAYIPLDVEFPPERLAQMLEDVCFPLVLTHSDVADRLPGICKSILKTDVIAGDILSCKKSNPPVVCDPDALAYVMFTSGSTGRPKGVEVVHRGIIRLLFGIDYVPLGADTVILHMAAVSFDASTFEIWGALLHGGTCVLCPSRIPTLDMIGQLLAKHHVNTFWMTAALFNLVVAEASWILKPVKYLLAGGEALSPWHVEKALRELPGVRLINGYGPTENTTFSTTYTFNHDRFNPEYPIPIGRAIGNSTCYVLDRYLRPVPVGVPGELYVGGDGVARGYANRPGLTSKRFLNDPFSSKPNARMYKTGDKVYWNPEGLIEFIGRVDNQVKLRGFRIELQDIDVVLGSFPGVEQSVTMVYEDAVRGKWLSGFVKVDDPEHFPVTELKEFACSKLPDYMVPSVFVPVAEWSYTPSGKLDKKALPKPVLSCPDRTEFRMPRNDTQKVLIEIWQHLFKLECIYIDDNFFDLGGDSLRAVHLFHEISQKLGCDLPLSTLALAPTIVELAKQIDGENETPDLSEYRSLKMIQQGDAGVVPLFLVHGGAGNVLVFNKFSKMLDSRQPVYAFQWSGWDGHRGESTVKAMARAYCKELLRFYPEGVLRLGGYCIGGLIAIELASQLEQAGRELVSPLLVWDSPNIESSYYRRDEPWDSAQTIEIFERMKEKLGAIRIETSIDSDITLQSNYSPPTGIGALIRKIPGGMLLLRRGNALKQYLQAVPVRIRIIATLASRKALPMELRPQYCERVMVRAVRCHRSSKYGGNVLYFRSDCVVGRFFSLSGWWNDPFLGFSELCEAKFEAYAIGGSHTDVLEIPEMAEIVRQAFQGKEG